MDHPNFLIFFSFSSFPLTFVYIQLKKLNIVVWVGEWTVPTERWPLVGEVRANFCGWRVPRGQRNGSLRPYSRFSRPQPLLFYQVAPQLYSRGWVDPVPDSLLLRISGSAGSRTRISGSVARNSDHQPTEAVSLSIYDYLYTCIYIYIYSCCPHFISFFRHTVFWAPVSVRHS
jgi:hypothetical protein